MPTVSSESIEYIPHFRLSEWSRMKYNNTVIWSLNEYQIKAIQNNISPKVEIEVSIEGTRPVILRTQKELPDSVSIQVLEREVADVLHSISGNFK